MMGKILSLPLLALLMLYKFLISPILQAVGVRCRHEPSCSTYSTDAIRRLSLIHISEPTRPY